MHLNERIMCWREKENGNDCSDSTLVNISAADVVAVDVVAVVAVDVVVVAVVATACLAEFQND